MAGRRQRRRGPRGQLVGTSCDRPQSPRGRGRRRTSRRRRRAAPGRCRCWTSPCRGGCAARGSAARGGRPGAPRRRPTPRRDDPGRCRSSPARDRHVAGVRAAVEERDAEALGGADHDVGTHRAGRLEQRQREQVGGHDGEGVALVGGLDQRPRVEDAAGGAGVLHQQPGQLTRLAGSPSARSATTTSMPIASARVRTTSIVCGSASASTTNGPRRLAVGAPYERHRLGGRGPLVEQRGVGGRQAGEVADDGLEVDQGLEAALGDLGLVGRVGGVPARVLEHVAPDHGRGDRGVVAEPDHRLAGAVGRRRWPAARGRWPPRSAAAGGRGPRGCGCRRARRPPSARRASRSRGARPWWRRRSG